MNICWIFIGKLLGAFGVFCKSTEVDSLYRSKMSLFRPYIDKVTGRVPFGDLSGECNIVSMGGDAGVHLTSSMAESFGSITSKHPLDMKNWKIDVHMSISPGAKGVGIWIMKNFEPGSILGGNATFNGILVYLAFMKNNGLSSASEYPVIGLATAYGGAPVIHFEKKVSFVESPVVTLRYLNNTLSVLYGGRNKKVYLVDALPRVVIDDRSFLTLSGQIQNASGNITVKTISVFKIHSLRRKRQFTQNEPPKTKSIMTWVVFSILIGVVGLYLYKQKSIKSKHKGILQQ